MKRPVSASLFVLLGVFFVLPAVSWAAITYQRTPGDASVAGSFNVAVASSHNDWGGSGDNIDVCYRDDNAIAVCSPTQVWTNSLSFELSLPAQHYGNVFMCPNAAPLANYTNGDFCQNVNFSQSENLLIFTPTPIATPTPSMTPTPSVTPLATLTPSPSPSDTPPPTPSSPDTLNPTPFITPTPTAVPFDTPVPTPIPTSEATPTPTPTPTPTLPLPAATGAIGWGVTVMVTPLPFLPTQVLAVENGRAVEALPDMISFKAEPEAPVDDIGKNQKLRNKTAATLAQTKVAAAQIKILKLAAPTTPPKPNPSGKKSALAKRPSFLGIFKRPYYGLALLLEKLTQLL